MKIVSGAEYGTLSVFVFDADARSGIRHHEIHAAFAGACSYDGREYLQYHCRGVGHMFP